MIIKALIVDDENPSRELLEKLLISYCHNVIVTGKASSVKEAKVLMEQEMPDLLFLDINMPVESGFMLLDAFNTNDEKPAVIFVTAYDSFAIKAFRYAAIDYLMKPVNAKELVGAIEKYSNSYKRTAQNSLAALQYYYEKKKFNKICLPVSEGYMFVETDRIQYILADGSYSVVYIEGHKTLTICKPLSAYEQLLREQGIFVRVHRSYLVNINKVVRIDMNENYLILSNNSKIPFSIRKKQAVIQIIKSISL